MVIYQSKPTFCIVTGPGDGVGDRRVDPHCPQEDPGVASASRLASQEHGKADNSKNRYSDIAQSTLPSVICNESNRHGKNRGRCVRGHTKQLSVN